MSLSRDFVEYWINSFDDDVIKDVKAFNRSLRYVSRWDFSSHMLPKYIAYQKLTKPLRKKLIVKVLRRRMAISLFG